MHPVQAMPSLARASIQMVEGDVVLDVGCGAGSFAHHIATKVSKVVAIDILESSIEIAKDFFSLPNIEFIAGDLFQLDFPDTSFDCILFLETIEHVDNPVKYLNEFHRILKPNGCLIISTPNAVSLLNIAINCYLFVPKALRLIVEGINKEPRNTSTHLDHIYLWNFETLYRLLNRNGFIYDNPAFTGFWPVSLTIIPGKIGFRFPFWTEKE